MASHFSTIGMPVESNDEMQAMCEKAAEKAEQISCSTGHYLKWSSEQGAELWLQIDNEGLAGVTPFFRGSAEIRVRITAEIVRPEDTKFEGALHGWADPQEDDSEGAYPFVFDLIDKGLYEDFDFPFISPVNLCAFAHELSLYDSDEEYDLSGGAGVKFALESFIPSGLFSSEGSSTEPPQSCAIFTGHILESEKLVNPLTGISYYWMRVKTFGGEIDVLSDLELVTKSPIVGGVVSGSFWLCGKIVNPKVRKKRGS